MTTGPSSTSQAMARTRDGSPLLTVKGLTTRFRTPRGILHAVDDVSFTLARGETLGIVGESGSGKSALARTIMNLTPAHALTCGQVQFDGRDLLHLDAKTARSIWGAEISMVFQDPATALNPVLRIGCQITESLELHLGLSRREATIRAADLLAKVGMSEPVRRLRSYPHELSGGMRQRVCIAVAIACQPKLVFADEPTTALDVTIQRQILDLLSTLQADTGMSMVLITHDFGVVAGRTHRIMVLYGGAVAEIGTTVSVFRETRHPYTAALLASAPRLEYRSHTPLAVIPGQPAQVVDPGPGCRFARRCQYAQPRCMEENPPLAAASVPGHYFACFYPVGTALGDEALAANRAAGRTAGGVEIDRGVRS